MTQKKANICNIHNCYGCGICAIACPKDIIDIKLNNEGFFEPSIIDKKRCTHCGICLSVCSFVDDHLSPLLFKTPISSYASWSNNAEIRHKCSSGGVGFEIADTLLNQGFKICGVRYNEDARIAEHYIASNPEKLRYSIGSKYLQSYTLTGFRAINRKDKYLITGTPCQIHSFRKYANFFHIENHFVFMDFFCHGVPSYYLWEKYFISTEKDIGKMTNVSWRNKEKGWHDSYSIHFNTHSDINQSYQSRLSSGDMFYRIFLSNNCLGRQCYNCKYKYNKSSADIRIGDFWGEHYKTNDEGVSCLITFTDIGHTIVQQINCNLIEYPFEIVAEGQDRENLLVDNRKRKRIITTLKNKKKALSDIFVVIETIDKLRYYRSLLIHPGRCFSSITSKLFNSKRKS